MYECYELREISLRYDLKEDRIQLIGNISSQKSRIDFWVTRRVTIKLLDSLSDILNFHTIHTTCKQSTQKTGRKKIEKRKIDKIENIELLEKINFIIDKKRGLYRVKFLSKQKEAVLTMNKDSFSGFVQLLTNNIPWAEWGIDRRFLS